LSRLCVTNGLGAALVAVVDFTFLERLAVVRSLAANHGLVARLSKMEDAVLLSIDFMNVAIPLDLWVEVFVQIRRHLFRVYLVKTVVLQPNQLVRRVGDAINDVAALCICERSGGANVFSEALEIERLLEFQPATLARNKPVRMFW